jgi:hypothetical protein
MTVRDFLSEAIMLAIVIVIGGAVSFFIVAVFLQLWASTLGLIVFENNGAK